MSRRRRVATLAGRAGGTVGLSLALVSVGGCGPRNYLNDNDRLRAENLGLRRQVEDLEQRVDLRLGQIQTLEARLNAVGGDPAGGASDVEMPVLSGVAIDRYSGPMDRDRDGVDDTLRLYIDTLDQRGRFLLTRATLSVTAAELPEAAADGGSTEPVRVLAERFVSAAEFDASYREGFTGPYHRVDLPLPADAPPEVAVRVVLRPVSAAGVALSDQVSFKLRRRPTGSAADQHP